VVSVTEVQTEAPALGEAPGLVSQEIFVGITNRDKQLVLAGWRDEGAACECPRSGVRHRVLRIIRDYSMQDRREAPQYYPPAYTSTTT
jgi:hypothetical protein